jgi:hypothetical protein
MLDRLRKRFENLIAGKTSVLEEELPEVEPPPEEAGAERADVEAVLLARRESQKRESRLILSERIHNRAQVLLAEVRTDLLQDVHRRLEEEIPNPSLHNLLEVTLDPGFTARLDTSIEELTAEVLEKLESEFAGNDEATPLFPNRAGFVKELASYRDEVLRKHLLEQIEVLALPTSAQAIPKDTLGGEVLKKRIAEYWASCRESLDKFFRSVEMVLLDGAREGIRLDSELIRERLVAAQYRNGYRLLDERFRILYGEIARFQMSAEPSEATEQTRAVLDRRVVDEIIVPLAYFIRERAEPEPRKALSGRAELFREIIDKLVAVPEPLNHTAEAIKPVLRKSVEQARPLVLREHSYLHTIIASLKPAAIHRTTALLKVFETLVQSDLDEKSLATLEQIIRLNRAQYQLLQQLEGNYPELARALGPFDRVNDRDAAILVQTIEQSAPPAALVTDLFLQLGYSEWPDPLPTDTRALLRLLAVLALTPSELSAWLSLYQDTVVSREDRSRLAQTLIDHIGPASIGADIRQAFLEAAPLPIDVSKALKSMGYRPDDIDRLESFVSELRVAIEDGDAGQLAKSVRGLRQLAISSANERVALGATGADGDPYLVEIWVTDKAAMVGLVVCNRVGFGTAPIEILHRDPAGGNRKETEEGLRRQLQNQALIYQSFYKLFSRETLLGKDQRRSLPSFVKKLYEPTEPNRHLLISRLRYARELVTLLTSFANLVVESAADASNEGKAVQQILGGLDKKIAELSQTTEKSHDHVVLARVLKEYDRALKYLNTVVIHAVNPWLARQTADLATEFEFRKQDVLEAVQLYMSQRGIDWEHDVEKFEAHGIRGTLGCRALMRLADGSSKVVLLNYHRRHQQWQVRYLGPRVTDVVRNALRQKGRSLPDDYDEKHEQPTFSLDEQSCRFFMMKRGVARVEATLVLDSTREENLWNVVYLRYNDDVLTDRTA